MSQFIIVSDLQAPEDFNGEHDIEGFWNSVHLEMISRGFFPSGTKNPFSVPPSYTSWAPWIGNETRTSDIVLNTEFQKVGISSSHEAKLSGVTEDRLLDELAKQKVGVARKLCKACNIDSKGSRFDLITRLREKMKSRQTYDKVFQSIWGASGGWSVILCPHGIVYSVKFNLHAESPRDFADLLLSWKHMPNVCVYDFARGLAAHTNLRVPDKLPFHPHVGRLAEPTEENVKAAQDGSLKVNLPWLHERMDSVNENPHPVTGSSDHYVLYDRFQEGNTKDPKDILRRIQLVPELKGWLNSQVVEQFFANMRKNNYFLSNMSPSTHVFLMRNITHHYNTVTNKKLLERQLRHGRLGKINISLSALGQAVVAPQVCSKPRETTETVLNPAPSMSGDTVPTDPQEGVDNKKANRRSTDATFPDPCGPPCKALTKPENILASRSSWCFVPHPGQQQLLNYVLDISRPKDELIVETSSGCLTRADFWTLGLNKEMELTIANGCFELITKIVQSKGISIYIGNLYVTRTWLAPYGCDPLQSFPTDAQRMDIIVLPLDTCSFPVVCKSCF
ncbi:HMG domain-containing protein 3-like isoform X1 [Nothobranchius furzeri]|uniref:HMG domain-containing protein 3-like isoform X1 n=2 Tax=Nothobranchius furzeri TaxID=105023 RepID=UPI003904B45B